MGYKLLGMAVWKLGTRYMRRRYGSVMVPKPMLVGGVALATAGAVLAVRRVRS